MHAATLPAARPDLRADRDRVTAPGIACTHRPHPAAVAFNPTHTAPMRDGEPRHISAILPEVLALISAGKDRR